MKLENFISSCRNPTVINGNSVRCGRCVDCKNSRAKTLTAMCTTEIKSNCYNFFFTLTYNEVHVPRCFVTEVLDDYERPIIQYKDFTMRPLSDGFKPLPEYNQVIHSHFPDKEFNDFIEKARIIPSHCSPKQKNFYEHNKIIRYLRKKDIQNFFKRLRDRISRLHYTKITYYACGEYGPKTFRPHYHVLLHFNESYLVPIIEDLVIKSWKHGAVREFSTIQSVQGASSYVAAYLNSYTHLPRYLASDAFKPFSSHSLGYGCQNLAPIRDYIYKNPALSTAEIDIPLHSGIYHYFPSSPIVRALFPRCYNFSRQTRDDLYKIYTCYCELSQTYDTTNCAELSRLLFNDSDSFYNKTLLDLLDIGTTAESPYYSPTYLREQEFKCSSLSLEVLEQMRGFKAELYYQRIYSRIYSTIWLSKHFLTWCCQDLTPREVLDIIIDHHDRQQRQQLFNQLMFQQEYNQLCITTDYRLFYPVNPQLDIDSYRCLYDESSFIKDVNISKDLLYQKSIKHKELNDANLIFV